MIRGASDKGLTVGVSVSGQEKKVKKKHSHRIALHLSHDRTMSWCVGVLAGERIQPTTLSS